MNKKRQYHHGNLRAEILRRAAEVIDTEGIEALTLRGIARDLGVSHGAPNRHFSNKAALLSALAADGWLKIKQATLSAADATGSNNAHTRLNAMGRGYLRWALNNRALFRTLYHPDVNRFADSELSDAIQQFSDNIHDAVAATQAEGRYPDVPLPILTLFTNAAPTGAAILLVDPLLESELDINSTEQQREQLIQQIIDLVVPPRKPQP